MTDNTREGVQAAKGGPSEAAVDAAQAHFDRPRCRTVIVDRRNVAQGLAAAYAVDEPLIRADQSRRIVAEIKRTAPLWPEQRAVLMALADHIAVQNGVYKSREFGATTHAE